MRHSYWRLSPRHIREAETISETHSPSMLFHIFHLLAWFRFLKMVDLLHEFNVLGGDLGQAPNEKDQLPVLKVLAAPTRHSHEANPVLDDVKDLSFGEALRFWLTQVRRRRVKSGVNLGLAAAIIRVTDRAMIREVIPGLGKC